MSYSHADRVREVFTKRLNTMDLRALIKLQEYSWALEAGEELAFHTRELFELENPMPKANHLPRTIVQAQPRKYDVEVALVPAAGLPHDEVRRLEEELAGTPCGKNTPTGANPMSE